MTLDEAILHAEEVVESCERGNPKKRSKLKCASEHSQLAAWLRELKAYKEQEPCNSCCGGDQKEKAKLCQKSYLAGLEHRQEPCEDCISRRDVIKMIESAQIISDGEYCGYCTEDINIDTLSSVTPEQKKGKWVDIRKDGNRIYRCRCSECGKDPIEYTYGYEDWWFEELPKFCPGCGAEMENEG